MGPWNPQCFILIDALDTGITDTGATNVDVI